MNTSAPVTPQDLGDALAAVREGTPNLGTPDDDTAAAMSLALAGAARARTLRVLDPVAAGALEWRTSLAHQLCDQSRPAIIRGNASEILALTGGGRPRDQPLP